MRYLLLSIISFCTLISSAALKPANFARSSRLASGKWVKVAVKEDGIYEISYETLRNLGFSEPEKVGLYGRGGHLLSSEFSSITGQPEYKDDLPQVPILQLNDKMYFYGQGTLALAFERNLLKYDGGGVFSRASNNLYSTEGYYFLSDSADPLLMETVESQSGGKNLKDYDLGVGVATHEVDLLFNKHNTGQLYFGEKMTPENPRLRFELNLPDAVPGALGGVQCVMYTDKVKDLPGFYGFEGEEEKIQTRDMLYAVSDYNAHSPSSSIMAIPSNKPVFYNEIDFDFNEGKELEVSHLDYWVISYAKNIPTLKDADGKDIPQDMIALPKLYYPNTGRINVPDGFNRVVLDISDPNYPKYLKSVREGNESIIYLTPGLVPPQLAFFNPMKTQKNVITRTLGNSNIINQDIHAQVCDGADLIIVCIPQLKQAAERLAAIHREKMNQRVVVVTTEECYNEFSNGMPDPQAIRSLVKMAYVSDYGCRNLLLMGPLFADFRGITSNKNPLEGIIAYQIPTTNSERGGFNANDYYGIMIEHIGSSSIEDLTVAVGVGILPIRYEAEADIYIEKVENYISRRDFAYYLNKFVSFGGVGDADLHSSQVPEMDRHLNSLGDRSVINSQVIVDAYGYQEAHDKLFRHADEGALIFTYFGHGNPCMLNLGGNFFLASDVYALRNTFHPFWGFAGCELTEPDKGHRGMGESVVVSTPYGMIGTLLATRDTWSSMNLDLFKKFFSSFMRDGGSFSSPFYKRAMSIGEIYARTKTLSKYSNEMAYQLVCDPAIVIPQVNRKIALNDESIKAVPGEWMEIEGFVRAFGSDDVDEDFNGEVVVRLMQPSQQLPCPHVIAKKDPDVGFPERDLMITYADTQMAMGAAEVKSGHFSLKIMVPSSAADFDGAEGNLHIAAYDPDTRLGAATLLYPSIKKSDAESTTLSADKKAPVIDRFEFDQNSKSLIIKVSDDLSLAFYSSPFDSPFRLILDGKEYRNGSSAQPRLDYEDVSFTKTVTLPDLQYGSHSAKVIVKDLAGNETSAEIVFDYLAPLEKFRLELSGNVVDNEGLFSVIGELPAEADIVILDSDGMLVNRDRIQNAEYRWNGADLNGNKVAPGLYKAYIIETGKKADKGHSQIINVPVI